MKKTIVGIDIGNVILKSDTDTSKSKKLSQSLVPGAIDSIAELVKRYGSESIWLVSKCFARMQMQSRIALEQNDFFSKTGADPYRVAFCVNRGDKAPICKQLHVTHFIDDRLEILGTLSSVEYKYAFAPRGRDLQKFGNYLGDTIHVQSWNEVLEQWK